MADYAQIILPVPIYNTYTYSIPPEMDGYVQIGSRVLVQFGKKGYFTGIVEDVHYNPPIGYEVKPIMMILDFEPILRSPQLKLWKWMSDYYLCSLGEVMKAALPSGLKVESETFIALNKDYEQDGSEPFTDKEYTLISFLESYSRIRISDIEKENLMSNVKHTINSLLEKGVILIDESVVDKYVSKKQTFVTLCCERSDTDRLHEIFNLVSRARRQESLLLAYLDITRWRSADEDNVEVEKKQLLKKADVSSSVLNTLVDKGVFRVVTRDINRFSDVASVKNVVSAMPVLTDIQRQARDEINNIWQAKDICLLRGVTGSGKTEIYASLIDEVLKEGKQALFLVPEISLTTQLTSRLRTIFGDKLLVYHSRFSDNERVDIWRKILNNREPLVVLGVRSSVFLPFSRLGLVIVDEEHEPSYKQYDPAPRYNARDTAMVLAALYGAKTLLGSATPSIETYYKAQNGKYGLVELLVRHAGVELPEVEIVDMRESRKRKLVNGPFSQRLLSGLRYMKNESAQSILFQNRRGFAPMVVCRECGWTPKCPNCDVSPVFHKRTAELKCHYCGYTSRIPTLCPACGENGIEVYGYGTERVEEDLKEVMPDASIVRMDFDTTRNKDAHQQIINGFAARDTDILIGTQMVSKGLDFDDVRLVGVLNADTLLNFPDFRSDERAFNMLEQVAGRAGRRKTRGHVIIQTTDPVNEVLKFVRMHDYASFYKMQLKERERFGYPPFTKVINIYLKHKDENVLRDIAVRYVQEMRKIFGNRVLGPEKPFVSRISSYYLQSVMLKVESAASMKKVKKLLREIFESLASDKRFKTVVMYYDVDPV